MKKFKIKSVIMTRIGMTRSYLITKERMEKYCKGEFGQRGDSVNDDLESLFEDIRLGKEPDDRLVLTYFLPKLTKEEMKLVEREDTSYLQTFTSRDPDVSEAEMMLSESDSKYVRGWNLRHTIIINSSLKNFCN